MTIGKTIKGDKLLQKRKTKNSDHYATNEQGKARTTAKAGRKSYSKKSRKASSRRRRRNERASAGKKRQEGKRRQAFKLADLLTDEEIKRLKAIK